MRLEQNVWQVYGLKGNPFDVRALSLVSEALLPIAKAFVGRAQDSKESQIMTNVLRNPGGACVMVEGEIGVGKTTFVNYHRFLWEHEASDKLFTPVNEIAVCGHWTVKDFLMNILGSLISKITLHPRAQKIMKSNRLFQEVLILSKVYFGETFQIEGGVLGMQFGLGRNEIVSVPAISETQLLQYFRQMVVEIKQLGYAGIFLHFDNMELLARREAQRMRMFFEEIRDTLQMPDVYFIFIGYRGFFSDIIASLERVRSIFFGYPIYLPPLSQEQVLEAIEKRYEILSQGKTFVKPVEDNFVLYLYKLFNGKMRFIMDAMNTLVPNLFVQSPVTLRAEDARSHLLQMTAERLISLTQTELRILRFAATQETFTNKQLCQRFQMLPANITRTLRSLQAANFIYVCHQTGTSIHYRVSEEVRIIQELPLQLPNAHSSAPKRSSAKQPHSFEQKVAAALQFLQGKTFAAQDYQNLLGVAASTARRYLKQLVDQGQVLRQGRGRKTRYKIATN